jgi:hypothetical protein
MTHITYAPVLAPRTPVFRWRRGGGFVQSGCVTQKPPSLCTLSSKGDELMYVCASGTQKAVALPFFHQVVPALKPKHLPIHLRPFFTLSQLYIVQCTCTGALLTHFLPRLHCMHSDGMGDSELLYVYSYANKANLEIERLYQRAHTHTHRANCYFSLAM